MVCFLEEGTLRCYPVRCMCLCVLALFHPLSWILLQKPCSSRFTEHIEQICSKQTAELSRPPAKQRRTSDAEGIQGVCIFEYVSNPCRSSHVPSASCRCAMPEETIP